MKTTRFEYKELAYSRTVINEFKDDEREIISYCINDFEFEKIIDSLLTSEYNDDIKTTFLVFTYCQRHRIDLSKTIFLNLKNTEIFDDENNNKGTWEDPTAWKFLIYLAWLIIKQEDSPKRLLYHQLERFLGDCTDKFIGDCVEIFPDTTRLLNLNGELIIFESSRKYYLATEFDGDNNTYPISSQALKNRLENYLTDGSIPAIATKEEMMQVEKIIKQLAAVR